ncbi:MAG TPA: hypothetical protein VFS20_25340 [Longimicrobium sp.]|nr:hypothetical protein [Longimicrobium sp.]
MKKLSMNLDALAVETFATVEPQMEESGTVRGQEADVAAWARTLMRTECHTNCSCPITW